MPVETPETIGFIDMLLAPYGLLSKSLHLQPMRGFLVFNLEWARLLSV